MRRFALYGAAAIVLLSLIVTVLKVTAGSTVPACPRCGGYDVRAVQNAVTLTGCLCRDCQEPFEGPAQGGLSRVDAIEHWLSD